MAIAMQDDAKMETATAKRAFSLLQTYIVRGLYNMTRVLKGEFIEHLRAFDLLSDFFKFLFNIAG